MKSVWLRAIASACVATIVVTACSPDSGDEALIEAGRRIYEDGILPNSEPLIATRPEGLVLEGRYAACTTCHRKSGMGSIEGLVDQSILVPPIAGALLFSPARFADSWLDESHHWVPHETWRRAMTRPAYDHESFAASLLSGKNSLGQDMLAPMPIYALDEPSLAALTAYLRQLSGAPDPGVESDTLHIASVVTPDVPAEDAKAVLGVLRSWVQSGLGAGTPTRLHEWRLTGPSGTWLKQLQDLYKNQPVFALLSGVGSTEWLSVHTFCEGQRVACIMPSVDVAPYERGDYYSIYLSTGVDLEARILADHLNDRDLPQRIVQFHADAAGRHAASAFLTRKEKAGEEVVTRKLQEMDPGKMFQDVGSDDIVVLWLRPAQIAALVAVLPDGPNAPTVFIGGLLATPEDLQLPPAWRKVTRFVTLFDDLGLQGEIARLRLEHWLNRHGLSLELNRRLQADAYAVSYLFNEALATIQRQELRRPAVPLTREHVLETLEDIVAKYSDGTQLVDENSHVAFYGRMSLGPGQRVAVRGGSILKYASPDSDRLVLASEHIVP